MTLRKNILLLVTFLLFLWGYSLLKSRESWTVIQKLEMNLENTTIGEASKIKGDAHTGDSFSRMTDANQFGIGYSYMYPHSLYNKSVKIIVEGWARTNLAQSKASIVIGLSHLDSTINWSPLNLTTAFTEPNKWIHFKDSMVLLKKYNGYQYTNISVYGYLSPGQGEIFDLDDFDVTLKILN